MDYDFYICYLHTYITKLALSLNEFLVILMFFGTYQFTNIINNHLLIYRSLVFRSDLIIRDLTIEKIIYILPKSIYTQPITVVLVFIFLYSQLIFVQELRNFKYQPILCVSSIYFFMYTTYGNINVINLSM